MSRPLDGKRILIVEDEYYIASDLAQALRVERADIVGPLGSVAAALSLVAREPLDAALLDVKLGAEWVYPIADRLKQRAVPFAFVTGYECAALPEAYREAPCLTKPFETRALLRTLDAMLAAPEPT